MKYPVAFFVLLSLLSANTAAQTKGQGVKKHPRRVSSRSENLQICQGVSLPDGYTIVGYVTSPLCPHGAYVLKKSAFQLSDAVVTAKRQPARPQVVKSRPRRVNVVQQARASSLLASTDSSPPTLSSTVPVSVPLKTAPAAVSTPEVEEVGAGDIVRINTTLVTVPVSVLDRQGRFVPDLRREDFHIFEDGIEQAIAYFEPTEKAFTVALMLDTSASTHFHLWEIKEAAIAFAKQLRPQDRILVVTFNDEVLLLTEPTNDRDVISEVIEKNANSGRATRLYDAVSLVVNERLNKIPGRKAIVLFTDGVDTSSYLATYRSTLREAEELDVLIYPIQYDTSDYVRSMLGAANISILTNRSKRPYPGSTSSRVIPGVPSIVGIPAPGLMRAEYERADTYLQGMADRTGGRLYQANDRTQLAQAFSQIGEELRRQYSLGYYPSAGAAQSDQRRMINVHIDRAEVAVRARSSYLRRAATIPKQ